MLCSREYQTIVSNVKFSIFSYRTYTHNLHSILVSRNIYPIYAKDPNFTILHRPFHSRISIWGKNFPASCDPDFHRRSHLIYLTVIYPSHLTRCIMHYSIGNIRITWISWKIGERKCAPVERLKIMIYSRFFLNTLNTKNLNCYSNDFYFK